MSPFRLMDELVSNADETTDYLVHLPKYNFECLADTRLARLVKQPFSRTGNQLA